MLYNLSQWWPLLLLACFAGYWWQAVRVKELAFSAAARRCKTEDVQLLDDSIALKTMGFKRSDGGPMGFERQYAFEFTSTGDQRYQGWVVMRGQRLVSVELPPHRLH